MADLPAPRPAALDQRQQSGEGRAITRGSGVEQLRDGSSWRLRHATLMTSVTPSMRSRMIRSIPALSVCVDAGQPTHAPISSTVITPRVLVDVVQDDVATVGAQRRADHLDGLFDLLAHAER